MLDSSWFKVCAFFQSSGRLLPCRSASSYHSLVSLSSGWFSRPLKVSSPHHLSIGVAIRLPTPRPALPPWPFEPRTSLVRFLSLLCTRSFLIYLFMCRTYTEIQLHSSILVLLLEQVRTLGRAKARLGRRHDDWWLFHNESFLFSKSSICCKECPWKPKISWMIKGDKRIMLCGTLESYPIEYRNLDGDFWFHNE